MSKKAIEVAARYRRKYWREVDLAIFEQYHINAFNHPQYPVIVQDEIQIAQWGLIPSWVKSIEQANEISNMTINAKAETLFEKPSFRNSIIHGRCIIPSTGFFEWRHEKGKKIPYFIKLKNDDIFSMAGLFEKWVHPELNEEIQSFSVITTEANPLMAYIHNTKKRMPVILSRDMEEDWLTPDLPDEKIRGFLHPFNDQEMEAYEIENFLSKSPYDPTILDKKYRV